MALADLLARGGMQRPTTLLDEYLGRAEAMRQNRLAEEEQQQQMSLRNLQMQKYQQEMDIAAEERTAAIEQRDMLNSARQQYQADIAAGMDKNAAKRKFAAVAMQFASPSVVGQMWGGLDAPAEQTIYGVPVSEATDDMLEAYARGDKTFTATAGEDTELRWKPGQIDRTNVASAVEGSAAYKRLGRGNKDDKELMVSSVDMAANSLIQQAAERNKVIRPEQAIGLVLQVADVSTSSSMFGDKFDNAIFNNTLQSNFDAWISQAPSVGRSNVAPNIPPPPVMGDEAPDNTLPIVPQRAIDFLQQNQDDPEIVKQFVAKYGKEAAAKYIGTAANVEEEFLTEPSPIIRTR